MLWSRLKISMFFKKSRLCDPQEPSLQSLTVSASFSIIVFNIYPIEVELGIASSVHNISTEEGLAR